MNFKKGQELKDADIKRQVLIKNFSIGLGVFFILFISSGFIFYRKKQEAEYNAQLSTSKLQSLRAQMNPHFIFNTLNSINDFILKNEKQSASNYLAKFANITRNILENTEQEEVSLSEEIEFLNNYITLEQQRLQHNFTFTIQTDSNINLDATLLPPSILQPFIENSIWHGLSSKEDGQLTINFSKTKENLRCIITDNGVGLLKDKETTSQKSFGLENVKNRLNLLNKAKNTNAHFKIYNNEKEGVTVEVLLPLSIDA